MKKQYERGSYNKASRRNKRFNMTISAEEYLQLQILSEQLKKNYSAILREGLYILWDKHKNEFMCESLFIDYLKTI